MLRVLGIDPGTAICGFGVVEEVGPRLLAREYGVVRTSPDEPLAVRLAAIFAQLEALIQRHQPQVLAVEQLFFNRNAQSALAVGHARGVALLAGARAALPIREFTPQQVKGAVAGYGSASKAQVQEMVRTLLALETVPRPDDAADALAVAICGVHSQPFFGRLEVGR